MRSAKALLLLGLLALSALNLAVTAMRSTIPLDLRGEVTRVERRFEKHRGLDDVYLVTFLGHRVQVDESVGKQLRAGDRISKRRWEKRLHTPHGVVSLAYSRDAHGMLPAMALIGLTGFVLFFGGKRE